jgi:GntR family transcriptional regulator, transcriptional repressor for pyruvate dehydrogenase complex
MSTGDLRALGSTIARHGSLSDRLAARFEDAIQDGELVVGTEIPSERVLAEQFGVSRTVVREAVRALVAKGLLEVRAGAGTTVSTPSPPDAARSMTLLLTTSSSKLRYEKVVEARSVIEVEIAGLAAERRTDENLVTLDAAVRALRADDLTRETFIAADVAFHQELARATQNELLEVLVDSFQHVMVRVRKAGFEIPGTVQGARHHHARILAAVRRGDGDASRLAMKRHLESAGRSLAKVREV